MNTSEDGLVARLRASGSVFAEDEARVLRESATSSDELEAMTARRLAGEPLEHVVGWADFGHLRVHVAPGVFVPRRRTELLARAAVDAAPHDGTVVDLCCGSGAVGAFVEDERPDVHVIAADIDPLAVRCATQNLVHGTVYEGDLFDALPEGLLGEVDVVAVNAPYVPTDAIALMPPEARDHEPRAALDGGPDGVDVHRRVAADVATWLAPHGQVLIETSRMQVPWTALALAQRGLRARLASWDAEIGTAVVCGRPVEPDLAVEELPPLEFAFAGPVRDRLVGLVLDGVKTTTSSLVRELLVTGGEDDEGMPAVGERWRIVDSTGSEVCVVETVEVRVSRVADVDLQHVLDEGEGDRTVAQWRENRTRFWEGDEMRTFLGAPAFTVDDDTNVVLQRLRVVKSL
ncbi:putative protein N(5)-glutamine methyltransferase [Mumia sp. zg.B17]|uniref:putative protein N(5)-glutamine methyltransferase n=1 Tax=unclassified Mumia TaxID=2621872 RepID=UPI001C6EEC16|nr:MULTISPECIES: putative protein N(5)-glutamine methyltransferase [unclassified Mumia]MBW9207805.1 putative protein N(5)-glutamine methyltransferase [Mumia sp. zg.B17]MDD9350063.1 putative protein N(5)-glutamine methyltransferase [Mumia sp.]